MLSYVQAQMFIDQYLHL